MRRSQGNGRAPPPPGDVRGEEKEEKAVATNGRAGAKKRKMENNTVRKSDSDCTFGGIGTRWRKRSDGKVILAEF